MPDLADDLRTYFDELAHQAVHATTPEMASPPVLPQRTGRRRVLAIAAALLVLVAAGITAALLHRSSSSSVDVGGVTTTTAASQWKLTVTPSDQLADGERVHIHATGFNPDQMVSIATCDARNLEPGVGDAVCDAPTSTPANLDGVLDTTYSVRRIIRVNGDPYDCGKEPRGCDLAVSPVPQPTLGLDHVGQRIRFVPGPAEPLPALSLTPSANLSDSKTITVTGTNFPPNASIWVAECPPTDCGYQAFGVLTQSDRDGTFHQPLTLHRTFTVPSNGTSPSHFDCTTGCTILGHAQPPAAQLTASLPFTMSGG
jgi:hypothetical protein